MTALSISDDDDDDDDDDGDIDDKHKNCLHYDDRKFANNHKLNLYHMVMTMIRIKDSGSDNYDDDDGDDIWNDDDDDKLAHFYSLY